MRGAGSSFGIVTSFAFQTFQAPEANVVFRYSIPDEDRGEVKNALAVLQDFAIDGQPPEMNMRSFIRPQGISLEGVYQGNEEAFDRIMQPLLENLGIRSRNDSTPQDDSDREVMGWIDALEAYANGPLTGGERWSETFVGLIVSLKAHHRNADSFRIIVQQESDATETESGCHLCPCGLLLRHGIGRFSGMYNPKSSG